VRLLLIFIALCSSVASAQNFPTKPLRWVVPTGPGSAVDVTARRIAPKLGEALGQPVIVDNRPGANSMIGARETARSAADGHTLFQAVVNNALNDLLMPDDCCKLNEKLVPVTRLVSTPLVMVVHPAVEARSVKEYVALAKSRPNQLTYASGGNGAITQMAGELLKVTTGIQVREIPYKAIGAEFPDLVGGHVSTAFLAPVVIRDSIKAGKIRGLAVAGPRRIGIIGEVPTMGEAGFPAIDAIGWNGIFVPAGTPAPVIERLRREIATILKSKEMLDDAQNLGYELGGESPQEFGNYVRAEIRKWASVVKDAGIKIQ
jgi:tripartite-type tricarboxylate transporter receptor subunit TctC